MTQGYGKKRRAKGQALFDELRALGALTREPTEAELDRHGDGILYADVEAKQDLQWIRSALHYAERTGTDAATPSERALFWIRVGGVLLDIRKTYDGMMRQGEETWGDVSESRVHTMMQALLNAIDDLAGQLEEDELFYLEYRRHVECHPRQSAYRARLRKAGALGPVKSKALGAKYEQGEGEDMLHRVLQRYGIDEDAIAMDFAQRLLQPLRAVETAALPLCLAQAWKCES